MKADANLNESCSHEYFLYSICNFSCSEGYLKVGAASSTCVETTEKLVSHRFATLVSSIFIMSSLFYLQDLSWRMLQNYVFQLFNKMHDKTSDV